MSDALPEHTSSSATPAFTRGAMTTGETLGGAVANDEPLWALIVGALLGATAFYLCAMWLGPNAGIAIALAAVIVTVVRREIPEAATFVAAAVLSAAALATSSAAIVLSALCFAAGLALTVRRRRTATVALLAG